MHQIFVMNQQGREIFPTQKMHNIKGKSLKITTHLLPIICRLQYSAVPNDKHFTSAQTAQRVPTPFFAAECLPARFGGFHRPHGEQRSKPKNDIPWNPDWFIEILI